MSQLPIISNFQGDFLLQLVLGDSEGTINSLAEAAAYHSVGRRVAPQPGKVIRVRRQGETGFYKPDAKVSDTDIKAMDCLEFVFSDPDKK
ncbi:MAG: toluene monooxygenase [Rhodocyclaceae bacterium]|nr:MAG: toluene monooxygenase [Rhodocyclaceae bacterium]